MANTSNGKLYCVLEVKSDSYVAACSDKMNLRTKSLFFQLVKLWERGENRGRKGPSSAKNKWCFQE